MHPLTLVMAGMAIWLGEWERMMVLSVSLLAHEAGHLAVARAAGVEVTELEILPLGGAIRLRGAWEMRPAQLLCVAMAGPMVNLALCCAATVVREPVWANANLVLLLFNLLPGLPLDGGRAVAGLLSMRMRMPRAVRLAVWGGRILSGILLVLFIESIRMGQANVTFLLSSIYMFLCGRREAALADASGLRSLLSRATEMQREGALPVRFLAVPREATVRQVTARLLPRHVHVICPCDEKMRPVGMVTEGELAAWVMRNGDRAVGEIAEEIFGRKKTIK